MIRPFNAIAVCLPSVVRNHQHRQADLEIVQIEKPLVHHYLFVTSV